jgi:hypothetical protein
VNDPRVLHAIAGAEVGGAEAFFERLAVALEEAGVTEHCVIRRNAARRALLEAADIPVTEAPFGGFFDFTTRGRLKQAIAAFRPEVVLSWMSRATDFVPYGTPEDKGFVHVGRLGGYYDLSTTATAIISSATLRISAPTGCAADLRRRGSTTFPTLCMPSAPCRSRARPLAHRAMCR